MSSVPSVSSNSSQSSIAADFLSDSAFDPQLFNIIGQYADSQGSRSLVRGLTFDRTCRRLVTPQQREHLAKYAELQEGDLPGLISDRDWDAVQVFQQKFPQQMRDTRWSDNDRREYFLHAIRTGDGRTVRSLLETSPFNEYTICDGIREASRRNSPEAVSLLIDKLFSFPASKIHQSAVEAAARFAMRTGNRNILAQLLQDKREVLNYYKHSEGTWASILFGGAICYRNEALAVAILQETQLDNDSLSSGLQTIARQGGSKELAEAILKQSSPKSLPLPSIHHSMTETLIPLMEQYADRFDSAKLDAKESAELFYSVKFYLLPNHWDLMERIAYRLDLSQINSSDLFAVANIARSCENANMASLFDNLLREKRY
jgi:hypothetical protein